MVADTLPQGCKFRMGRIVATPGAMCVLLERDIDPLLLLQRHVQGDWGDVNEEDADANVEAVRNGYRVFSAYNINSGDDAVRIWVITEADRSSTCILLPEEY